MAQYIISYFGGDQPSTPEAGQAHKQKYMQWIGSIGKAAISPMNPMMNCKTINPDGSVSNGSSVSMSGYTIIESDTIDTAIDIAKTCPFLEINGTLEVAELMQMPS